MDFLTQYVATGVIAVLGGIVAVFIKKELRRHDDDFKEIKTRLNENTRDIKIRLKEISAELDTIKKPVWKLDTKVESLHDRLDRIEKVANGCD